MTGEMIVLVSCPQESAKAIATPLIEEGLAACVNIVPSVTSIFKWQGKITEENESLLLIKSNQKVWTQLENRIRQIHSYDIPEIICVPIQLAHQPYLQWLNGALTQVVADSPKNIEKSG
jgi:periplasmic divalent cation tolerance protein